MRRKAAVYMEKRLPFRAFDGAFGTYYFQLTGDGGPCERANVDNPSLVRRIHRQYLEAGAKAVKTNTFALNAQVDGQKLFTALNGFDKRLTLNAAPPVTLTLRDQTLNREDLLMLCVKVMERLLARMELSAA